MTQNIDKKLAAFKKLSLITLIAVYFLILVGGIVRSTGSGMGCPDWPKCFGSWIPPTSPDQLPDNYQEKYSMQRHEKNIKFANYLSRIGMDETASRILNDENILVEDKFNAKKTWTEYVNRLVGATIGFLMILTTVKALPIRKSNPGIVIMSILTLVIIGFQGWLGSIVVSTKLLPGMVTTHMLLALLIVAMISYLWFKADNKVVDFKPDFLSILLIMNLVFFVIQILLGTQVREGVDVTGSDAIANGTWIEQIGVTFYVHRSFSILILALNIFLFYKLMKEIGKENRNYLLSRAILWLIMLEMMTGASMAYFSIPSYLQPVHLLIGTLLFGLNFLLLLNLSAREAKIHYAYE